MPKPITEGGISRLFEVNCLNANDGQVTCEYWSKTRDNDEVISEIQDHFDSQGLWPYSVRAWITRTHWQTIWLAKGIDN